MHSYAHFYRQGVFFIEKYDIREEWHKKVDTKPIIALDLPSKEEVFNFLAQFGEEKLFVKIGMELFYSEGPELVRAIKKMGHWVFLDLKLHDIPNTVNRAMKGLAALGVDMVNVHAAGGSEMMRAARLGLEAGTPEGEATPLLIAVTQLTSTTEESMQAEQLIPHNLDKSVTHYAKLTQDAGLAGVVCSALEVERIHQATSKDFICLTPGIRSTGSDVGDQKRVATPEKAREWGAGYIVVGRPITQAADPVAAYHTIKQQWGGIN